MTCSSTRLQSQKNGNYSTAFKSITRRIRTYKLIINQPFQSTQNVLAVTFRFLLSTYPGLKRLEYLWRYYPHHIALYDSLNQTSIPVAVTVEEKICVTIITSLLLTRGINLIWALVYPY